MNFDGRSKHSESVKISDIDVFWQKAPVKLKKFVKSFVVQKHYEDDPTGMILSGRIWEFCKWRVSEECCSDIIQHYVEESRNEKGRQI